MDWSEINKAIQEKVDAATEGKNEDEVDKAKAEVLKNLAHPIRQFIHDGGHKQATARSAEQIRQLESEKSDLEGKLKAAKEKLEKVEENVPDAEQIKEQYQQEIADLKKKHEGAVQELNGKISQLKTGGFTGKLLGHVGPKLSEAGEDWAKSKIMLMEQEGRIRPTETGFEVLQPGKKIPYTAETEDELIQVVSGEILDHAKPWALKGTSDSGGGSSNGKESADKGGWDKIRKEAKARHAQSGADAESINKRRESLLGA